MAHLKELLIEELQDLLFAETQLTKALPEMAAAAHNPKLKEAFTKHLAQTENQIERLHKAFELLGAKASPKQCKAMLGLVAEGKERIQETKGKDPLIADLAMIGAAQKIEHYEIAGYGTVRGIARLIQAKEVAKLLDHTLGEEESADFLLTTIAEPILQHACMEEMGASQEDLKLVATR